MIQSKHLRRSLKEGVSSKLSLFQLCEKLELLKCGKKTICCCCSEGGFSEAGRGVEGEYHPENS